MDLTPDERLAVMRGSQMERMLGTVEYQFMVSQIADLRDSVSYAVLEGVEDYANYMKHVGMIEAIDKILAIPMVAIDVANELRDELAA